MDQYQKIYRQIVDGSWNFLALEMSSGCAELVRRGVTDTSAERRDCQSHTRRDVLTYAVPQSSRNNALSPMQSNDLTHVSSQSFQIRDPHSLKRRGSGSSVTREESQLTTE